MGADTAADTDVDAVYTANANADPGSRSNMDARHPSDIRPDPVLTDCMEQARTRKRQRKAGRFGKPDARAANAPDHRDDGRQAKAGRGSRRGPAEPVVKRGGGHGVPPGLDADRGTRGQRNGRADNQRKRHPARVKPRGPTTAAESVNTARGVGPYTMAPLKGDGSAPARLFSPRTMPRWMYSYPDDRNEIIAQQAAMILALQKELRRASRKTS